MSVVLGARELAIFALALAAAACGGAKDVNGWASPGPPIPATVVRVENNNWSDVNVYAVRSGQRFRLGTVPSISERVFRLPAGFSIPGGEVELLVDPIGSSLTHSTGRIMFNPGDEIIWRIENHLPLSSYSLRANRG
jgi:hypothetical protein